MINTIINAVFTPESLLVVAFSGLFLVRVRWAVALLLASAFLSYLISGLNFAGFLPRLSPLLVLAYFSSLLLATLHLRRAALPSAGSLPMQVKLFLAYLIVFALLATAFGPRLGASATLPSLTAFAFGLMAMFILRPEVFSDDVGKLLMAPFVLLVGAFLAELVFDRNIALVLGIAEPGQFLHGSYDAFGFVLQGLLGNANESAGATAVLLPLFWMRSSRWRVGGWRTAVRVGVLVATIAVIARSWNRTGIVALVLALVLFLRPRRRRAVYWIPALLVVLLLLSADSAVLDERLSVAFGSDVSNSISERIYRIWLPHLEASTASPEALIFGYGPNAWHAMPVGPRVVTSAGEAVPYSPHNIWVFLLYTQGLVGVVFLGGLWLTSVVSASRIRGDDRWCYVAGLVAWFVWSLGSNAHRPYGIYLLVALSFAASARRGLELRGLPPRRRDLRSPVAPPLAVAP